MITCDYFKWYLLYMTFEYSTIMSVNRCVSATSIRRAQNQICPLLHWYQKVLFLKVTCSFAVTHFTAVTMHVKVPFSVFIFVLMISLNQINENNDCAWILYFAKLIIVPSNRWKDTKFVLPWFDNRYNFHFYSQNVQIISNKYKASDRKI